MLKEKKPSSKELKTSPEFLAVLAEALNQINQNSFTIEEMGLLFFSQGYLLGLSCEGAEDLRTPFENISDPIEIEE